MDKKIIQFEKYLKAKSTQPAASSGPDGRAILSSLPPAELEAVVNFILKYVFDEVRLGLGITDVPEGAEEPNIEDLKIFNKIADLYEEAAGNCYFCSEAIDPNEDEFGPETELCLMCKLKLANFTESLSIPAGKVFKGMKSRKMQTKRILIDGNS